MKRLIKSSKFWLAITGTIAGIVTWNFTSNVIITSMIIGLFGAGSIGTTLEDSFGLNRTGNPDPKPPGGGD